MRDYVCDLETLGTEPGAVVLTIGAVEMDRSKGAIVREFYRRIDVQSSLEHGLKIDGDTMGWWLKQSQRVRLEAIDAGPRLPLSEVVSEFAEWLGNRDEVVIYGNGPSFDCGLWSAACAAVGSPEPWHFRNERCIRTEKAAYERRGVAWQSLHKSTLAEEFPRHHALYDAKREALELLATEMKMDHEIALLKGGEK